MCAVGNYQLKYDHHFSKIKCMFDDDVNEKVVGSLNWDGPPWLLSGQDQLFELGVDTNTCNVYKILDDGSIVLVKNVSNEPILGFRIRNLGLFLKWLTGNTYRLVDYNMQEFGRFVIDSDKELTVACGDYLAIISAQTIRLIKFLKCLQPQREPRLKQYELKTQQQSEQSWFEPINACNNSNNLHNVISTDVTHIEFSEVIIELSNPITKPLSSYYNSIGDRFIIIAADLGIIHSYTIITFDVLTKQEKIHFNLVGRSIRIDVKECGHSIVQIENKLYFFDQENVMFNEIKQHQCQYTVMVPLSYNNVKKIYDAIYNTTRLPRVCIEIIFKCLNIKLSC